MFGRLACCLKKDLLRRKRHFFSPSPMCDRQKCGADVPARVA
jgi:hypothetical protein